jgi:hypothetical protein
MADLLAPSSSSRRSGSVSPRSSATLPSGAAAAAKMIVLGGSLASIKGGGGGGGHASTIQCIAEVDDTVWTGSGNGLVVIFNSTDGSLVTSHHLPVIGTGSNGGGVGRTSASFDHVSSIMNVWRADAAGFGGDYVWCGSSDGTIFIVNKQVGLLSSFSSHPSSPLLVLVSPSPSPPLPLPLFLSFSSSSLLPLPSCSQSFYFYYSDWSKRFSTTRAHRLSHVY